MFRSNTVIVVGAGASNEYNLPLGGGLTDVIAYDVNIRFDRTGGRLISGDEYVIAALRQAGFAESQNEDINRYLPACRAIVSGMSEAQSIDTFINSRESDRYIELVAKIGILRSILRAERESDLWVDTGNIYNTIAFEKIQSTWLPKLRRFLCDGVPKEKVAERFEKVTLIIFNYDRCVEHYWINSLRNYYGIDEKEAAQMLQSMTIIHPYGVVAPLPWQEVGNHLPFGETELRGQLLQHVDDIRTFAEQSQNDELSEKIRESVGNASLMMFLGFAFHHQNINLLIPDNTVGHRHVYGTAVGLSKPVQGILSGKLAKAFADNNRKIVTLDSDCKCADLIDKYGDVFTAI